MSDSRSQVLGAIRAALGGGDRAEARRTAEARIAAHARNIVPARTAVPAAELADLFLTMATEVAATVERVADLDAVPGAVAAYLASHNLPAEARVAPDVAGLPWASRTALTISAGPARDGDAVSVTGAFAGVAETGTLMLTSGPGHPTTLNFLPDTHIVVLPRSRVVAAYEDGWDRLRAEGGLPRTVNFVTGPSRTGDIEQTIQLGAHGPRRLHILLVEGA
ncbi:L-lactate dehydrogenase complex protein LldG [Azospirillum fermentarium]|uniref:LutC/YkgG family protein n=1 Tax=Azospirillum fermentarium TaxID=1233114 RepID=UPI0022280BA2|nr:lactate utilization protein [Azospirillum fermentarium]MCW2244863.1 L-lactate dehydrogenase complex protein LldG [Azospirillum fermentarium]